MAWFLTPLELYETFFVLFYFGEPLAGQNLIEASALAGGSDPVAQSGIKGGETVIGVSVAGIARLACGLLLSLIGLHGISFLLFGWLFNLTGRE